MIGSLVYLMNCSRHGIAYAMNRVTRYTQNLNKDHWKALNRIMRYLRGAMDCGLHFCGKPSVFEGYTDAN